MPGVAVSEEATALALLFLTRNGPRAGRRPAANRRVLTGLLRSCRQAHDERRAAAACALDFELAAGPADDVARLIGADAHSHLALGAVERPKQAVAHERFVHAAAGVHDGHDELGGFPAEPDADSTVGRGGVLGVAHEV